jgi:hypothetical protein
MTMELVRATPDQRRCALYHHYDAYGVLLYVGISDTPVDRTNSHARSSEWVQFADRAEIQWHDSRALAEKAEREAIADEAPVFNRQHAVGDVDRRIADYLREREMQDLRDTLSAYEGIVARFIGGLDKNIRQRAEEAARSDYRCADQSMDRVFPAHVLRHSLREIRAFIHEVQDAACHATLDVIEQDILARREQVKQKAEARQAPSEPLF